jgi:hypothetical protein
MAIFITLFIIFSVPCVLWLSLYKPWINPKVGEIWKYQADDPFEEPIYYEILDNKNGYVKLKVIKEQYPYKVGYITSRMLLGFRDNIEKVDNV